MTGEQVTAGTLHTGDLIHLQPHRVAGHLTGHTERDVQITAGPWLVDHGTRAVFWWADCLRFPGSSATLCGAAVYDLDGPVLWIGHIGGVL